MNEKSYKLGGETHQKKFLVIAGNIGSGKTTLTKKLSEHFGWVPHFEPVVDNPFLEDFYKDMKRWSFSLQIYFLDHRFNAHRMIESSPVTGIQDRSIYEDAHVFARSLFEQGMMDPRDYECYLGIFHSMLNYLSKPTLVIYLQRSVPKLMERIRRRGRDFEKGIAPEYLERLNHYYDEWFDSYDAGKKLLIETDEMDFLSSHDDFMAIVESIKKQLVGTPNAEEWSFRINSNS